MPVLADEDIIPNVAADQKLNSDDNLKDYWTTIVAGANERAKADICQILTEKGYPLDLIEQWDDFGTYQRDQCLFWAGIHGRSMVTKDNAVALNALDCRSALQAMTLIRINGLPVYPPSDSTKPPRKRSGVLVNDGRKNPLLYRGGLGRPHYDF